MDPITLDFVKKMHTERALKWFTKKKNVLLLCYTLSLVLVVVSSFSVSTMLRSLGHAMIKLDYNGADSIEIFGNNIEDKINSIEGIVQETSSACLLVCDDNHFLIGMFVLFEKLKDKYTYYSKNLNLLVFTKFLYS